jgi:hypothetical protein
VVLAIGRDRQPLPGPKDSHQVLGPVIVGGEIGIADRPILTDAILHRLRFEIPLGHPQRDPRPGVGSSAHGVNPRPVEIGSRGGAIAIDVGMDIEVFSVGAHLPESVILPRFAQAPEGHLIGPGVLGVEDLGSIPFWTDLELQDIQATVDQDVGGNAPGGSGADDDYVVDGRRFFDLHRNATLSLNYEGKQKVTENGRTENW